jgi:FkbM family methyltransferase
MAPLDKEVTRVDDLIYDVGMHKGEDSAFYLAKGYRVVSFEANAELVAECRQRFAAEIDAGRLRIVEGAVTASDEPTVRFFKHPVSTWGTTVEQIDARNAITAGSEIVDVPAVNFTSILRETGIPSFMKVDIEGADMLCLEALLQFEQRPQSVSMEGHKTDWSELEASFSLLEQIGYDRFAVIQQGGIIGRVLNTRTLDGKPLAFRFEQDASGGFGSEIGPWTDRAAALARYKRVFLGYRLLGEESWLRSTKVGRRLHARARRYLKRPLPGWFDTHAARSTELGPPTFAGPPELG